MKKLTCIEQLERTIAQHTERQKTPKNVFLADMLAYYQRVGHDVATVLLERMQTTIGDGGHRGDLAAMVSAELAKLPALH